MTFTIDMTKAVKNIKADVDKRIRGGFLEFSGLVIKSTPVAAPETWINPDPTYIGGSLRGAWNVSVGQPDFSNDGTIDKTGASTIAKAAVSAKNWKVGDPLYLTNPLPYAMPIELGWSKQSAPGDMVRANLMRFQKHLDRAT